MRSTAPKWIDCQEHDESSELFICEGDSAARTIQRVRNVRNQAVLAMQGKPMNADKASLRELRANRQFAALIQALNVDPEAGRAAQDLAAIEDSLRYSKIILLFDPDADGIHARTLMLFYFHRWMPTLLSAGRVYDTHAPQWKLTGKGLEGAVHAATPSHMRALREELESKGITEVQTQRFRGLGNFDGETLSELCIDPATRRLQALGPKDADQARAIFEQMRSLGQPL